MGCKQLSEEKLIPLSLLNLKVLNRNEKKTLRYRVLCVIRENKQTHLFELVDKVDSICIEKLGIKFEK